MSTRKRPNPAVVRVQNLRRSGAAGTHSKPYNRSAEKRTSITRNREEN